MGIAQGYSADQRIPTLKRESIGLRQIASSASEEPHTVLNGLLTAAVELCGGGAATSTAGVSLLEAAPDGGQQFRWVALAGRLAAQVGGTTPRGFSPCGECLDQDQSIILKRPDLKYPYFAAAGIEFTEGLVVPFKNTMDSACLGTIWVISHPPIRHRFDADDVSLMETLTNFASSCYCLGLDRNAADGTRRDYRDTVAAVSHDMRTPLNTIAGCVDLLTLEIEGALTSGQSDYLERIRKSAQLLLAGITALSETVAADGNSAGYQRPS